MPPLPRQINSADPNDLRESIRQIVDYLHALPRFEIIATDTSTGVSHTMETDLQHPLGLLLMQAYETNDPDKTLTLRALPDWRPVAEGLEDRRNTGEVDHTLVFLAIGEGE